MLEVKKEKVFEIYTVSGKRVTVKGFDLITTIPAGDLTIYDETGAVIAQFQLDNIEGWRIASYDSIM